MHRHLRIASSALFCMVIGFLCRASAADLRITSAIRHSDGRFEVSFASEPDHYYLLHRGGEVSSINAPVAAVLGGEGNATLEVNATDPGASFYRIASVPISEPLDTDGDGVDDATELLNGLDPLSAGGSIWTTIRETSPSRGERNVAVTRETILRFSRPLAPASVLSSSNFFATFGERRLLSRVELGTDRLTATLFHLEHLPPSARVGVTFDPKDLVDQDGRELDADGDSMPGGILRFEFETLSTTAVPGTIVVGHVHAAALGGGDDGSPTNQPLSGVVIQVDGAEETLRTTTDSLGFFRLDPAPAGNFFVTVDGRTALGSSYPEGGYYPFVRKAWSALPGHTNLANGTGEVFLPYIRANSLKAVSAVEETVIGFPPEVLAGNPALAGVSLTVPPNALFGDDGTRGGRVGIAPVPPDRLPEPLPPGLDFPLVITVQTDGPANFDRPVPVRFPNLPDPVTGVTLPPGAKSILWSFNHDTGAWEPQGEVTVSADGLYFDTDPGVGIRQPGWHGIFGVLLNTLSISRSCNKNECAFSVGTGILDCGYAIVTAPLSGVACVVVSGHYGAMSGLMQCLATDPTSCALTASVNVSSVLACGVKSIPGLGAMISCGGSILSIARSCLACAVDLP
ncbi:MAG: Ig-like domain-containing protein, partial [Limisphaerales bacterium]